MHFTENLEKVIRDYKNRFVLDTMYDTSKIGRGKIPIANGVFLHAITCIVELIS